MKTFFVAGGDDGNLIISSYRISYRVSHAVSHAVSRPVSYPNGVLFPNDPSSALARGVVYDGVPFDAPCNPPYNAEANSTRDVVVYYYNSPTVRRSLWTNTNILYTGGTNSRDRKRFLHQGLGESRHTFLVSQPLEVGQG
jgi:hypothetical protein